MLREFSRADGYDQLVFNDGDATLLIHQGKELVETFAKDGELSAPACTNSTEFKCSLQLMRITFGADGCD